MYFEMGLMLQTSIAQCITNYETCKRLVEQLALFSENEEIEDIATSELKYRSPLFEMFDQLDTSLSISISVS